MVHGADLRVIALQVLIGMEDDARYRLGLYAMDEGCSVRWLRHSKGSEGEAPRCPYSFAPKRPGNLSFQLIVVWSLTDEIHELIELRRDDDLCTTVTLTTQLSIVGGDGVVLTTTTSSEALRIYTIVVLQGLNH